MFDSMDQSHSETILGKIKTNKKVFPSFLKTRVQLTRTPPPLSPSSPIKPIFINCTVVAHCRRAGVAGTTMRSWLDTYIPTYLFIFSSPQVTVKKEKGIKQSKRCTADISSSQKNSRLLRKFGWTDGRPTPISVRPKGDNISAPLIEHNQTTVQLDLSTTSTKLLSQKIDTQVL